MFDQPYLTLNVSGSVIRGFTANSKTYVFSSGQNSSAILPTPIYTGLGPGNSTSDLDYCGAWLNAAIVNPSNASEVFGFYHEEWACDYANNFFTNKSIAFALSQDGGQTFTKPNYPNNAIILPANWTASHQTGEGDHGVVLVDNYLYLFFTEWDGPTGTTIGAARVPLADVPLAFELAFCVTIHRAQCETIDEPYVVLDSRKIVTLDPAYARALLYVAASRATSASLVRFGP
jgi:hypothetical protein